MKRAFVGLLLLLLVPSADAKSPRKAYLATLREHTDHEVVYNGFATALNVRGTLLSRPMRDALVAERQRLMRPSEPNHADFVRRMDEDGAQYHEVVFSVDTPMQEEHARFGEGDRAWNLRLLADGVEQPLVSVEWIRRPTPIHRGLYPHLNLWSELWIARFERVDDAPARVELSIGSGLGHATLAWE